MRPDTSPVNAPSLSQCIFCAAIAIELPRAEWVAEERDVKGGATTMSQWEADATSGANATKNARVSAWVLYIFQLPAITWRRMTGYLPILSASTSTPGSLEPARNSSEAPPPVEMCEILSATPDSWIAATESPPPTIEVAPADAAAATALEISSVPLANAGISNTPIGPFHTIVLA